MKFKELKKLDKNELEKKSRELKTELAKAKASKTNSKIKQIKKIIARIETFNTSKKKDIERK